MVRIKKQTKFMLYGLGLILLITGLFFLNRTPNNSKPPSENAETVVFLGNKNIPPIVYNDDGTAKGISVDIAKELGIKMGMNVEVRTMDWNEAQELVLLGEADALLQMNHNPVREEMYDFSDDLLASEFSIFIRNGNLSIKKPADLKNKRVGVESGGHPYIMLRNDEAIDLEIIYDRKTGFSQILSGHLDAIVVDRWGGEYELAQAKIRDIEVLDEPLDTQYSSIAVKKGNTELLHSINTGLEEMNQDGTMAEILDKWSSKKVIYFTREIMRSMMIRVFVLILTLILLLAGYLIYKYRKLSKELEIDVLARTNELRKSNDLLREANAELERMAMIDGLTGITNRRGFDIVYEKAWATGKNEKQPLALIMIDIDHFKLFNDTYGHLAGDDCLISVVKELKTFLKGTGHLIARFGGEEFVVVLEDTTSDEAALIAEEMRKKIESLEINFKDLTYKVTISLGVGAMIPNDNLHSDQLIYKVDKALYEAKEKGRNKVLMVR